MEPESTDHNKNTTCCLGASHWPGIHSRSNSASPTPSKSAWDSTFPVPALGTMAAVVAVITLAVGCFACTLNGEFVFDDSEAIINNNDLLPDTPWWNVFFNDFWGTRLTHNSSHKSYRPLTVLSFRLNYYLSDGLHPKGFHLVNVLLHAVVSALLIPVFTALLDESFSKISPSAFLCALLFAVHPVHTECVAGIVGRADLLCALFFFLTFLVYVRATHPRYGYRPLRWCLSLVAFSMILCAISMLCKEQGITAIGLCSAYDIIIVCRLDFVEHFRLLYLFPSNHQNYNRHLKGRSKSPELLNGTSDFSSHEPHIVTYSSAPNAKWWKPVLCRHLILFLAGCLMMFLRWHIMGSSAPTFQQVDNPASFASTFYERTINYNYVYALNAWLLVFPKWLCFDWSMGCIPLIHSPLDIRILAVFIFWLVLGMLLAMALFKPSKSERRSLTMALAVLIIPFLPASNLFFRVGFVIAERVLYIPSVGFCMLIILGLRRLYSSTDKSKLIPPSFVVLLIVFIVRCHQRSLEWQNEEILFRSGVAVCPLNAKAHYNIAKNAADAGKKEIAISEYREAIRLNPSYDQAMNNLANILKDQGELKDAEELLQKAIFLRFDFAAAWMNLGIVQSTLKKYELAERSYLTAIAFRRKYPDCYYNLGNLYLDQGRYDDAYIAWRNATQLKPTHTVSWNNMIIMLDSKGELEKAESVANEALKVLPHEPSLHFNLANTLGKDGRYFESEKHFLRAIQLNKNNPTYFTNLGVLYHRWKKYDKAEKAYRHALLLNSKMKSARENLDLLLRTVAKEQGNST